MKIEYAIKIKALRNILNLSQQEVANMLYFDNKAIGRRTISYYETGARIPSEKAIKKLCDSLNISYEFFGNYNYTVDQSERFMIDLLWYELISISKNLHGIYRVKNRRGTNTINNQCFVFTSVKLRRYINEYYDLKEKLIGKDNKKLIEYILRFPYSSQYFDETISKSNHLCISSKNNTINDLTILNLNYKIKVLKNLNLLESSNDYTNIELLKENNTDMNQIPEKFINSLCWNDIFNSTDTIIESSSLKFSYYYDDDISKYIRQYFAYKEEYINNDYNYTNYISKTLLIGKKGE